MQCLIYQANYTRLKKGEFWCNKEQIKIWKKKDSKTVLSFLSLSLYFSDRAILQRKRD